MTKISNTDTLLERNGITGGATIYFSLAPCPQKCRNLCREPSFSIAGGWKLSCASCSVNPWFSAVQEFQCRPAPHRMLSFTIRQLVWFYSIQIVDSWGAFQSLMIQKLDSRMKTEIYKLVLYQINSATNAKSRFPSTQSYVNITESADCFSSEPTSFARPQRIFVSISIILSSPFQCILQFAKSEGTGWCPKTARGLFTPRYQFFPQNVHCTLALYLCGITAVLESPYLKESINSVHENYSFLGHWIRNITFLSVFLILQSSSEYW